MYDTLQDVAYYSIGFLIVLTFLTLVVSCERIKYHIKFSFFVAVTVISATLSIPFSLFRIKDWRNALGTARCLSMCGKVLGVTYHIHGKENIVQKTGSIVLINHQSVLDLCVLGLLWPLLKRCTIIAKKEILYFGPFGIACWLWGVIFINRQKSEEAHNTIDAAAKTVKDLKANLIIFPEGHRHSNSTLLPFKKGAFYLAYASQMPIQPIVISKYYFLNAKSKRFDPGTNYITILPPISTDSLTRENLPMFVENVYNIMNKTFIETSQKTLKEHVNSLEDA